METATDTQQGQCTTRRAFLKRMVALTGVSADAAFLTACGSASATASPAATSDALAASAAAGASASAAPTDAPVTLPSVATTAQ